MDARAVPTAVVTARGRARVLAGHPWIFRQDVARGPATDAAEGGPHIVRITDGRGQLLGRATWAARARIALRVLDREGDRDGRHDHGRADGPDHRRDAGDWARGHGLDDLLALIDQRMAAARVRRADLASARDAYRLVHGESDALPGLFVDVYADTAVVQTSSVAMDAARPAIVDLVMRRIGVRVVIAREDGSAREFEGLQRFAGIAAGAGSTTVVYRIGENRFEADLLADAKTGGFLDQADNHGIVAALAPRGARCLDAFTHHGGFALALARRGGRVLAVDEDARAVARALANAGHNGLGNVEVRRADAFDLLRELESRGERYDVVVLDPPALAKRGTGRVGAQRAYGELVLRGLRLCAPGGLVVACSCSGAVSRVAFDDICTEAAAHSGRLVQVLARLGAGRDHPEHALVPETGHLKCWLLRVVD